MTDRSFWSRVKNARLVRLLAVYLGASWAILQGVELLQDGLSLPTWVMPVALILLTIGFFIVLVTAWVQSHPLMEAREAADDVPGDWELALSEMKDSILRGEIPHPNWARATMGGIFMFSLLFGATGLYVVIQDRGETFQPPPIYAGEAAPSIAVLPFRVSSSALQEWEEGLVDLLSTGLDGAAELRAVDSRTILSLWDRSVGGSVRPDLTTALQVARDAGARFALDGSVTSMGSSVRLETQVYDLDSGRSLGTAQVDGSLDTPHELVDRFSMEILQILLGGDAEDLPPVDLAAVTTTSTEALKAYLQGERYYREGRFEQATRSYQDAVAIDSTFALAYHRLFLASGWGEFRTNPLRGRYRERAVELVDRLPERERLLVRGSYRMKRSPSDSTTLETALEDAVEYYPNDAEAWYLLGETYFHEPALIMRPTEIEQIFGRAIELDPDFAAYRIHHVQYAFSFHGDSALATERVRGYRDLAGADDSFVHRFEGALDLAFGDEVARRAAMDRFRELPPEDRRGVIFELLVHPRSLEVQERVLREEMERNTDPDALRRVAGGLFGNLMSQGRLGAAMEILEHPAVTRGEERCNLFGAGIGFPIPMDESRRRAAIERPLDRPIPSPEDEVFDAICGAALSAELGIRDSFLASRERITALAENAEARGDTALADDVRDQARVMDGLWAWMQENRPEEAIRVMEVTWRYNGFPWPSLVGKAYLDAGRLREAEEAYLADYFYPPVWYALAGIYEELGEREAARDAWERVVTAWQDPDPELRPLLERARSRLGSLRSPRAE